ncbi:unnamed protein product [Cochlearia groenlandica]
MGNVSLLTILFRDQLQKHHKETVENHDIVVEKPVCIKPSLDNDHENYRMTKWLSSWSTSSFQMPLNYPTYTKEDYEFMSEQDLDRLLKLYGLPIDIGDLSYKKEFAVGAFLWEKELDYSMAEVDSEDHDSSIVGLDDEISLMGEIKIVMKDMFNLIFRLGK